MTIGDLSDSYRHIVLNSHPCSGGKKSLTQAWSSTVARKVAGYINDLAPSVDELANAKGRELGDDENG